MDVKINDYCHQRCVFCYDYNNVSNNNRLMPLKVFMNIVDNYLDISCFGREVLITGGEPTFHPCLIDMIKYCKYHNVKVYLISNGGKLADSDFLNNVVNAGVDVIQLSIHGSNSKIHDKIVGYDGSFANVMSAIENAKQNPDVQLCTNSVLNTYNFTDTESLLGVLADIVHPYQFLISSCFGKTLAQNGVPSAINYEDIIPLIEQVILHIEKNKLNGKYIGPLPKCLTAHTLLSLDSVCSACSSSIQFLPDGKISPCAAITNESLYVDPKNYNSIRQAIVDIESKFQQYFEQNIRQRCAICEDLNECRSACFIKYKEEKNDPQITNMISSYIKNNSLPKPIKSIPELALSVVESDNKLYLRIGIGHIKLADTDDVTTIIKDLKKNFPGIDVTLLPTMELVVTYSSDALKDSMSPKNIYYLGERLWMELFDSDITQYIDIDMANHVAHNLNFQEELCDL